MIKWDNSNDRDVPVSYFYSNSNLFFFFISPDYQKSQLLKIILLSYDFYDYKLYRIQTETALFILTPIQTQIIVILDFNEDNSNTEKVYFTLKFVIAFKHLMLHSQFYY